MPPSTSLATASLAGAAAVAPATQSPASLPGLDRVPEPGKAPGVPDLPASEIVENAPGSSDPGLANTSDSSDGSDDSIPSQSTGQTVLPATITTQAALPARTLKESVVPARETKQGASLPKGISDAPFLPSPEGAISGKEPESEGQTEEACHIDPASHEEILEPAKKPANDPGRLMLDHLPKLLAPPAVRMVNSKRITINYEVKDVGPSGVSGVELWCTQDGKSWKKREVSRQAKPPYVVEVSEEGLYGFTLRARNGIGLCAEAPKPGDLPQIWVEVDMTSPVVKLTGVNASCNGSKQNLIIHWKASDKNLGPRPITLSYSQSKEGPWQVMAANIPNTGRHVWPMPSQTPARFLVRVQATDLVGNVGASQTPKPVLMDRSQPVVNILNVDSEGK
jgi:hypothetical protein